MHLTGRSHHLFRAYNAGGRLAIRDIWNLMRDIFLIGRPTRISVYGLMVLAAVTISACIPLSAKQEVAPIKVGVFVAQTGPFAELGTEVLRGVEMAVSDIKGQRPALNRRLMVVVDYDNGGASEGTAKAENLIDDEKVLAIIMGASQSSCRAASEIALSKGVVPIVADEMMCDSTDGVNAPAFSVGASEKDIARSIATYASNRYSRLAIVHDASAWGLNGAKMLQSELQKNGKEPVIVQPLEARTNIPSAVDGISTVMGAYRDRAQEVYQAGADAVVLWSLGNNAASFVVSLRQIGYKGDIVGGRGLAMKAFPVLAKEMASGAVFADTLDGQKAATKNFIDAYERRYNEPLTADWAARGYDAASITVETLQRVDFDRSRLAEALKDVRTFDGATGVQKLRAGFGLENRDELAPEEVILKTWNNDLIGGP